jgi:hypothetical protein
MATPAQVIANQANSQKSTGPVTEAGKAKSSRNRLSHGFASSTRFIPGEDPEQFKALLLDLMREYRPATPTQQILVEKMAHHQWITLRANRIQGNLLADTRDFGEVHRTLPLMIRYQTTAERAFHKAHEALLKAQKEMPNREIGFESQTASEPANAAGEAASNSPAPAPKSKKSSPPLAFEAEAHAFMNYLEQKLGISTNAGIEEMSPAGL